MKKSFSTAAFLTACMSDLFLLYSCGSNQRTRQDPVVVQSAGNALLRRNEMGDWVGQITPNDLRAVRTWQNEWSAPRFQESAADALAHVPSGGEILVVLGTWCGDSRREVVRFEQAIATRTEWPFAVRRIAVDRRKEAPELPGDLGIRYVPTFIVRRDGREIGRVVESAPMGIEVALRELLDGSRNGLITGRTDL